MYRVFVAIGPPILAVLLVGSAARASSTPPSSLEGGELTPVHSLNVRGPLHTKADWRVIAYQSPGEEGRFGNLPARICFRAGTMAADCTSLIHAATNDADRLVYQTVTGLSVTRMMRLPSEVSVVMAQAEMSYGGSGTSTQYALWSYRAATDRFAPLATFQVSEQGELQVIDDGPLAGCVVTADYLLGAGESHFGRHRFSITVHRLDPVTLRFQDVLHYVTLAKYPSLDEGGVDVVRPELPQMRRILRYIYPHDYEAH